MTELLSICILLEVALEMSNCLCLFIFYFQQLVKIPNTWFAWSLSIESPRLDECDLKMSLQAGFVGFSYVQPKL